eukprot:635730-Hanusia_phi.AAC.1
MGEGGREGGGEGRVKIGRERSEGLTGGFAAGEGEGRSPSGSQTSPCCSSCAKLRSPSSAKIFSPPYPVMALSPSLPPPPPPPASPPPPPPVLFLSSSRPVRLASSSSSLRSPATLSTTSHRCLQLLPLHLALEGDIQA